MQENTYEKCNICGEETFDFCAEVCESCQAYECNACGSHVAEDKQCTCCDES